MNPASVPPAATQPVGRKPLPSQFWGTPRLVNGQIVYPSQPRHVPQSTTPALPDRPSIATLEYNPKKRGVKVVAGSNYQSYGITCSTRNDEVTFHSNRGLPDLEHTFSAAGKYNLAVKSGRLVITKI